MDFQAFKEEVVRISAKLAALAAVFFAVSMFINFLPEDSTGFIAKTKKPPQLVAVNNDPAPELSAEAILVKRMATGEVILAKNEAKPMAIASLVKLMAALIFTENLPPLEEVRVTAEAVSFLESDEKKSKIVPGDKVKAEDLLKFVIAESDNDAAYGAADAVILKIAPEYSSADFRDRIMAFVDLMNKKKDAFGLSGTSFMNPAGRDSLLSFSTANDLFILSGEINRLAPNIWNISRMIEGEVYSADGRDYRFENTNVLLKEFPAIYGSKTGFTDEAGQTLLMLYELAPREPIFIVILKSQDRFSDGRAILRWIDSSFKIKI